MQRSPHRVIPALAVFALVLSAPSTAQVIVAASLGREILQNVLFHSVKDELIGSLAGMGCRGATLAGMISAAENSRGRLPAAAMPGGPRTPQGARGMGASRGGVPMGGMDPAAMSRAVAMAEQQMGGAMSAEQRAATQRSFASMQDAMAKPLSREETMTVFDELAGLGVLTESMRSQARDCIAFAPPGSGDSVGAAGAIMKNMILPSLRRAKQRMASFSADEQKQLADGMIGALNSASAADRGAFLDGLGGGFFPRPVVEQVRARVAR